MRMAEKEQMHRHVMESEVIDADVNSERRGQVFALIMGLATVSWGAYLIMNGHPVAGGIVSSSVLLGLVSVFVYGRWHRKSD